MTTPFRPDSLDAPTLRRLAQNLKKGFPEVFPTTEIALHQAQELIARAFRYPDWHHAIHARATPEGKASSLSAPPDQDPPLAFALLVSVWESPALRTLVFATLAQGLDANFLLRDIFNDLVKGLITIERQDLARLVEQEAPYLLPQNGSRIEWSVLATRVAPYSSKVAMLVRLMSVAEKAGNLASGFETIAHQCELEQTQGFFCDERPFGRFDERHRTAAPSGRNDPWRFASHRHMLIQALKVCLDQDLNMLSTLCLVHDDFKDNGHLELAEQIEGWMHSLRDDGDNGSGWRRSFARSLAPYSLEGALMVLLNPLLSSISQTFTVLERQSEREMMRASSASDGDLGPEIETSNAAALPPRRSPPHNLLVKRSG